MSSQAQHGLGVSEFEVLEWLAQHGKDDCRMQELSEGVHLSQSALSRLVGRLEADGLVHRKMCQADRRGIYACITAEGRGPLRGGAPDAARVLAATWDGVSSTARRAWRSNSLSR